MYTQQKMTQSLGHFYYHIYYSAEPSSTSASGAS